MKKIISSLFAALVLCASCSKDENSIVPADGQYIADAGDLVAVIVLKNGNCTYFAPFVDGEVFSSWTNVSTSGDYPKYTYKVSGLNITSTFSGVTAFSAVLDGVLVKGQDGVNIGSTRLSFDSSVVQFKLDSRVLDENGDGILDEKQQEIR